MWNCSKTSLVKWFRVILEGSDGIEKIILKCGVSIMVNIKLDSRYNYVTASI